MVKKATRYHSALEQQSPGIHKTTAKLSLGKIFADGDATSNEKRL